MNILFTTSAAPKVSPFGTHEKRPPLGVGSLISLARDKGHKVFFIDNYLEPSNFIEKKYLQRNKIDLVGIYANSICFEDSLKMLNKIEALRKKALWKGKIAVGGPHTAVAVDTIPDFVDYVVQGEGENALFEIISGRANSRIIKGQRLKELDFLPFQPWDIFNKLPYDDTCPWMDIEPVFTMNTSRGCPFKCIFCSVGSIWGEQYTNFSANRITAEIEYLVKNFKAKGIYFREDDFTLDQNRLVEFCNLLKRKNIEIQWACETRVDNLSKELLELMSASGCRALYLGIESGSQRILDFINKKITVEQIENAINWSKKYGIRTYCSLICGLPGETFEDYMITKNLMERLNPNFLKFNVFVGMPISPLYKYILENNLHEYMDGRRLLYLPGYNIKAKFFYGKESRYIVDYNFRKRTDFDEKLLREKAPNVRGVLKTIKDRISNKIPRAVRKRIKKVIKKCQEQLF